MMRHLPRGTQDGCQEKLLVAGYLWPLCIAGTSAKEAIFPAEAPRAGETTQAVGTGPGGAVQASEAH